MRTTALFLWLVLLVQWFAGASGACGQLVVSGLRCEQRESPLAVESRTPRLSWVVSSARRGQLQSAYRVLVAKSREALASGRGELWDSGRVQSADTLGVVYAGAPLARSMECFWKVMVWDKDGVPSAWSEPAVWEMGLLDAADWSARWINDGRENARDEAGLYAEDPAPRFRRDFALSKPIRRARLHISGLGYYEASINGRRVGDHVLDPGWTSYERRVLCSTFDVTELLVRGDNCIGVMLGNGWYNPLPLRMWGHLNLREHLAVGRPRVIASLCIDYADGTSERVGSDTSWRVGESPIRFNNVYLGEVYDARRESEGWDRAGFDDSSWRAAALATETIGGLSAQAQPPIRVIERFAAVSVSEPRPGVFVYDMGQNFAGWVSVKFGDALSAGAKIVLRYGELLYPASDGARAGELNPMTSVCGQIKGKRRNAAGVEESIGGPGAPGIAWQSDTYIAAGGREESYTPRFTFHGFRYVEVTGLERALPLDAVTGVRLSADVRSVGTFACSNERFNRIQEICRRTFLSNLFGVQSDCPHRERFGYGGDIVATCDAMMMNFDMSTFYAKAARDWAEGARADGVFTDTAPFVGILYCGVGWAMVHPLLLERLHRVYGETGLIDEQYGAAARWFGSVAAKNGDGMIAEGLGDHEALDATPAAEVVPAFFAESARIMARLARVRGREADAERFESLGRGVAAAYEAKYVDRASGRIGSGTQTAQSIALACGLAREEDRERVTGFLVEKINGKDEGRLTTGIFGTRFMLDELCEAGRADVAYAMVDRREFPGWGWMLENGATTLWEHWALDDNTFSHNHPMFGSVSGWFINWLGGIQPAVDGVGCDRVVIRPQAVAGLEWVRCGYESARGMIRSEWRREGGVLRLEVEIPVGVEALVYVPRGAAELVTESGRELARAEGVAVVRVERGSVVCRVGSGRYVFEVRG